MVPGGTGIGMVGVDIYAMQMHERRQERPRGVEVWRLGLLRLC